MLLSEQNLVRISEKEYGVGVKSSYLFQKFRIVQAKQCVREYGWDPF